jgi:hypothetical protein
MAILMTVLLQEAIPIAVIRLAGLACVPVPAPEGEA